MIAGGITLYLVNIAQESSIRCAFLSLSLCFDLLTFAFLSAEEWRNDARNPYAARLAKESLH